MKLLKRALVTFIIIIILLATAIYFFTKQDKFGTIATGERLHRMESAPNYHDGHFDNLESTPSLAEGESYFTVMKKWAFTKNPNKIPKVEIPHVKTDIKNIPINTNVYIWFGHSSYYMQLDGIRILVDPVFSGNASPINNIKAFHGSNTYTEEDFPEIDLLIITHDHWDHLDYLTVRGLRDRTKKVLTGLGVGAHFEKWGYAPDKIIELYWGEKASIAGIEIESCTARHFSGRSFTRNQTLWSSFALRTPSLNIYVGGDSGYGKHFRDIGQRLGPFDYVILENGQYNESWRYIHMLPYEMIDAAIDLGAKKIIPVHSSKFVLSIHDWDEPLLKASKFAKAKDQTLLTPRIGEIVYFDRNQVFDAWWQ